MRLSAVLSDPGYRPDARAKVYLDGQEVRDCITADEELGVVTVHQRDNEGRLILNDDRTECVTKDYFGHVRIEARD